MNEEQLQEIQRTLEAGEVPSAADIKFLFDTIALRATERDAADDKAADYLKLCDERAARISALVKERDGWKAQAIESVGDSLKSSARVSAAHNIAKIAVDKCEELRANLEMFKAIALHNKQLGEQAFSERDEARAIAAHFFQESIGYMFAAKLAADKRNRAIQECARLEVEKCLVEIQRDQARELACKAIESFGVPAVLQVSFAGEEVTNYGAPDPDCLDCDQFADEHRERGNDGEPADDNANTGAAGGAVHYDGGKLSFNNVPEEGERALVEVFSYGERKYGFRNWEKKPGLTALQYYGSMRRHLQDWRASIDNDKESGLPHLAHVAANALMCLVTLRNDPASDNRKAAQ